MRIFTPTTEYPFAGHPTLGSAAAWLALGGIPKNPRELVQECGAGLIPVRREGDDLAFATPPLTRSGPLPPEEILRIAAVLGVGQEEILAHAWGSNGPVWRLVQLRDAETVRAARPAPARGDLRFGIVGLESPGAEFTYEVRAFGADYEDPVTGSLQGSVAQWLFERGLVPAEYTATQGSQVGRRGRVTVTHQSAPAIPRPDGASPSDGSPLTLRTWIGGRAPVMVRGELNL